jgi:hypothetical protein
MAKDLTRHRLPSDRHSPTGGSGDVGMKGRHGWRLRPSRTEAITESGMGAGAPALCNRTSPMSPHSHLRITDQMSRGSGATRNHTSIPSRRGGCPFLMDTRPEAGFTRKRAGGRVESRLCPVDELPRGLGRQTGSLRPARCTPRCRSSTRWPRPVQAVLDVHSNAPPGKAGVLCLAPLQGLGVSDNQRRERHAEQINRFPEAKRGALRPRHARLAATHSHEAGDGSGPGNSPQGAKGRHLEHDHPAD